METDLHLQISQRQARLKHENFTLSYHSYTTLLLQNILQLQLHFSCTLYSINNLRFTKIRVSCSHGVIVIVNRSWLQSITVFWVIVIDWTDQKWNVIDYIANLIVIDGYFRE